MSRYGFRVLGLSNSIKTISVGPAPPDVTIVVDGAISDSIGVIVGQDIVIECDATDGNPTPDVTIIINGDIVGDTKAAATKHTLTVEEDHSDLNISCQAVKKVSSADSDLQSLQLFCKFTLLTYCVDNVSIHC